MTKFSDLKVQSDLKVDDKVQGSRFNHLSLVFSLLRRKKTAPPVALTLW
jgi:hypothetical protein